MRALLPLLLVAACQLHGAMRLTWPTPNNAYLEGRELTEFIQDTGTGLVESGTYGCVRNSGARFHEGIDLFPVSRDSRGEATDPIVAIADGIVRHISSRPGEGSYGRYVVIEHTDLTPAIYTLYAHLASIADGIGVGTKVSRGTKIGIMGRSASGYTIPRERAHLHLEIGLRLSDDFDSWYRAQKYGNPNRHGVYNGRNLAAFDPLGFFDAFSKGRIQQPVDFIATLPVAVTVLVFSEDMPDFGRRYPSLVEGEAPAFGRTNWEVDFHGSGLPIVIRPSRTPPAAPQRQGERWRILAQDAGEVASWTCRDLVARVRPRAGMPAFAPGKDLDNQLRLLFGER